jgi:hypothetical protein
VSSSCVLILPETKLNNDLPEAHKSGADRTPNREAELLLHRPIFSYACVRVKELA